MVFGTDYDTRDGTCVRDYIHVADLADAHVKALQALEGGAASGACNLGIGQGFSVREVVAAVERVTGLNVPVVYGPRRGNAIILLSKAESPPPPDGFGRPTSIAAVNMEDLFKEALIDRTATVRVATLRLRRPAPGGAEIGLARPTAMERPSA